MTNKPKLEREQFFAYWAFYQHTDMTIDEYIEMIHKRVEQDKMWKILEDEDSPRLR